MELPDPMQRRQAMRGLAVGLLSLAVVACTSPNVTASPGPAQTTSPAAIVTSTPIPNASVLIKCMDATYPPPPPSPSPGYVGGNFCTNAWPAVLAALEGQGGVPTMVVFASGLYCPLPGMLFPGITCPGGGIPPSPGGQSLGHAVVSFAGTADQAYLNVWQDPLSGLHMTAQLIGIASPPPSQSPAPS